MFSSGRLFAVGGPLLGAGVVIVVGWLIYADQSHVTFWSWLGILGIVITVLGLAALLTGWVIPEKEGKEEKAQTTPIKLVQRGGQHSTNYQAGRDIKFKKGKEKNLSMRANQEQSGGDGSSNFQAGRDIVNYGISYTDARAIALDVFEDNFLRLAGVARDVARERAEEITNDYINRLQEVNPDALNNVQDPDVVHAIYTAQEGYARSGEEDLEQTLVNLLVERTGQTERGLKSLSLNEAISILPKLTIAQRKTIATCFFVRCIGYNGPPILGPAFAFMGSSLTPFAAEVCTHRVDYQHIEAVRAGTISILSVTLEMALSQSYRGFFTRGFTPEQIPDSLSGYKDDSGVFIPCLRDPKKLQVAAMTTDAIMKLAESRGIDRNLLDGLSKNGIMTESEIQSTVVTQIPALKVLFERWHGMDPGLNKLELTSAGITIGHAYWSQFSGFPTAAPLDIWIPA